VTISIRQLEAFKAVTITGSITRASKVLEISQPAASRLINSFSDSVGFPLFQRSSGQLVPTQEARYLLDEATRLLDGLANFESLAKDVHMRKSGHFDIACLPGLATSMLPGVLAEFLKSRPGVTLSLEPDRPERILEWIISRQYDVGITDGFQGHPAVIHKTLKMRTVCILPPGHRLSALAEIRPVDLRDEGIIHSTKESAFFRDLETEFTSCGVPIKSLAVIRQFGTACLMVAAGAGVSIVSEIDAYEYESKGLIIRPFVPETPHELAILYPTHSPRSMLVMEFVESFLESVSRYLIDSQ
jgi:DNA-binding transcriptional LysR family regulator